MNTMAVPDQDRAKKTAGDRAARELCHDGMRLGLGSGTTSHFFVRALADRVKDGLDIVGVPTSVATRDLALELGVPLADLNDVPELDLCIDGPDEMEPRGAMIKGGGACLLWEKVVSRASRRTVIVADDTKMVEHLGAFPLPIEVLPFGWVSTGRLVTELLRRHGYDDPNPRRRTHDADVVVTDSGNFILDVALGRVNDPETLTFELNLIPGVIENGLFVGMADAVVIGRTDGTSDILDLNRN